MDENEALVTVVALLEQLKPHHLEVALEGIDLSDEAYADMVKTLTAMSEKK